MSYNGKCQANLTIGSATSSASNKYGFAAEIPDPEGKETFIKPITGLLFQTLSTTPIKQLHSYATAVMCLEQHKLIIITQCHFPHFFLPTGNLGIESIVCANLREF